MVDEVKWTAPDSDGVTRFLVSLSFEGILEAGLNLSGVALADFPKMNTTFELFASDQRGRSVRLMRMDWRSLRGGHKNTRRPTGSTLPRRTDPTHFHSFDLNWNPSTKRMRGRRLPLAQNIDEDLQSFEALRGWTGNAFRINNIDLVPSPPWRYNLFNEVGWN